MHRSLTAVLALVALAVAGCGSATSEAGSPGKAASASADAFPVTLEHKFGQTRIDSEPKRIVVVGLREQDSLLALGIVPVGTTEWFGKHDGAIFPWAEKALGDAKRPEVLSYTDGIQYERVAALAPDLILAVYSGLNRKDYDTLSKLAPVVAQPRGQVDWGSSWQDEITMTGKAVGKAKEAEALKAKAEQQLAAAAAANPGFKGQTAAVATPYQGIYVYGPQDARSRLLTDLGFTFPPGLQDIGGKEFGGQLSDEKVDLLDVGALLWFAEPAAEAKLKKHAVYSKLDVRKQGRDLYVAEQGTLYEATSFISVLSIPYLIENLVPKLAAAADGDPATA
jgi:iron complex transport system substrate-binding protein